MPGYFLALPKSWAFHVSSIQGDVYKKHLQFRFSHNTEILVVGETILNWVVSKVKQLKTGLLCISITKNN
jgi:hypothetical protein